jgi:hypothetical protein
MAKQANIGTLFLSAALALSAFIPTQAHGALPGFAFRTNGLSGAQSAYVNQIRTITSSGLNIGINNAINHALQGQITNGVLQGTQYDSYGGNSNFERFAPHTLAFGSNPLSFNGSDPGNTSVPSTVTNFLTFASSPRIGGKSGGIGAFYHLSGSERVAQNQLKGIAGSAVLTGSKIGNSIVSSPIVGGQFYGTDYELEGFGNTYSKNATFDFAFGSDPLNTGGGFGFVTLNTSLFRNYIQLANGRVFTFSSGLLQATTYGSNGHYASGQLYSIGSDPLNFFNNFSMGPNTVTFTGISYLHR